MDRYKVSGLELRDFYEGETPLRKVFADIEKDLQSTERVVCRFIVNGLEFSETDELKFADMPLSQVTSLEYLTESKKIIHVQVVEGWLSALPELISGSEKLSQKINVGGMRSNWRDVKDLADNCLFLVNSLATLQSVIGDRYLSMITTWVTCEKNMHTAVSQLLKSLEAKDEKTAAIVLDFDLPSCLEDWRKTLATLMQKFNESSERSAS